MTWWPRSCDLNVNWWQKVRMHISPIILTAEHNETICITPCQSCKKLHNWLHVNSVRSHKQKKKHMTLYDLKCPWAKATGTNYTWTTTIWLRYDQSWQFWMITDNTVAMMTQHIPQIVILAWHGLERSQATGHWSQGKKKLSGKVWNRFKVGHWNSCCSLPLL